MQFCSHWACIFVSMLDQRHHSFHVRRCVVIFTEGISARSVDKFFSVFTAKHVLFTRSCPTSKVFRRPCLVSKWQMLTYSNQCLNHLASFSASASDESWGCERLGTRLSTIYCQFVYMYHSHILEPRSICVCLKLPQ